ncbi:MAG: hypothetical protein E7163_02930 [Firmicutes bacterium]|nr:hypothetical protein [Bacillota bacterium]
MPYFIDLNIKNYFSSQEDYNDFIEWYNLLLEDYIYKYNYLGIKKENWIKLFKNKILHEIDQKKH